MLPEAHAMPPESHEDFPMSKDQLAALLAVLLADPDFVNRMIKELDSTGDDGG